MNIYKFVREEEFALISFSFDLIKEVEERFIIGLSFTKNRLIVFWRRK